MLPRRQLALTDGFLFFLFLTWQLVAFTGEHGEHSSYGFLWASCTSSESLPLEQDILAVPQKRHIVAVASTFGFHFDVYTLRTGSVQVYAPWYFPHKFQMIVDERGIYHGVNKKSEELIPAINANMGDGGIDLIILGLAKAFGCLGRKRCRPQHHIFILLEPESDSGVVSKTCHPHSRDRGARCDTFRRSGPILATKHIRNAYKYADDDRAVVTRPAATREVEALRALRTGDTSYFLNKTGISTDSPTAEAAEKMLRLGWVRSEEFRVFKQNIWNAIAL
ncbi:hypothetical protein K438DRAFT_1816814 [Mycena galopus ATCC 62051]|nr:hypothetical protein K438DRAFT_1816814 [Mycena galopus ATCC 62051]